MLPKPLVSLAFSPQSADSTALLRLHVAETIGFLMFFTAKCRQYSTFGPPCCRNHLIFNVFCRDVQRFIKEIALEDAGGSLGSPEAFPNTTH